MANEFMDNYNNLWTKTVPFDSNKVETQHVGIIRMASVHEDGLPAALAACGSFGTPEYIRAALLYYNLPTRYPGYKKLPKKKTKKVLSKKQARQVEKIRAKYNVNDIHAAQIIKIMKLNKKRIGE